jgi:hypothetical protein
MLRAPCDNGRAGRCRYRTKLQIGLWQGRIMPKLRRRLDEKELIGTLKKMLDKPA